MTQPATRPASAPTKTARHVRRTLRFAWLEYQDARDGVQLTRSLTAHGGWLNAFYALDPDPKSKKRRSDHKRPDLDIGFETNASGSGIIARPQTKHGDFLVEWVLSPGIAESQLTLAADADVMVDLIGISGHGSRGVVFGTDRVGNHTTRIDLTLLDRFLGDPHRKADVSGSLQYLVVASCSNLVFENFEMWQHLLRHPRGVRGIFGYRDAYTGDAQGAAIMNRFARAWRERPEETLLDNWRKANPHDPWAAIVLDDARGDTMQDWLAGELAPAKDRRGMRHFDATSFKNGGRKLEHDPPITAKWVMEDGTALDRSNRKDPNKGLFPGQRGKVVIESKEGTLFAQGDKIVVVVNHYRPTKRFDLRKLLTLDASAHVRLLFGANKESGVKNLLDGFEVTVPAAARRVSVDFTVNADAAKKFAPGEDQDFGYFILSVWPPPPLDQERVYMYATGANLRAPKLPT